MSEIHFIVEETAPLALFEIEDSETVTVLVIRHQREEDFF